MVKLGVEWEREAAECDMAHVFVLLFYDLFVEGCTAVSY